MYLPMYATNINTLKKRKYEIHASAAAATCKKLG